MSLWFVVPALLCSEAADDQLQSPETPEGACPHGRIKKYLGDREDGGLTWAPMDSTPLNLDVIGRPWA